MLEIRCVAGSIILAGLISGCGGSDEENVDNFSASGSGTNCSSFSTQSAAQSFFNNYNAPQLDADNDGIACEHLPKGLLLVDDNSATSYTDISLYIGDYTLLGLNCKDEDCRVQPVSLTIDSEQTMTLCLQLDIETSCDSDRRTQHRVLSQVGQMLTIKSGTVELGSVKSGHIKLSFNDDDYYGQHILLTDTLADGSYNHNGVFRQADGGYRLTSYAGRVIQWQPTNGITITQN